MNFDHFRSRYLDWFHFGTMPIPVRVLHVLQPSAPAPPQMAPGYAPELDDKKKAAHALVERIASELRRGGFKVETAVVTYRNSATTPRN